MNATTKRILIIVSSIACLGALLAVQFRELSRERQRSQPPPPVVPASSRECVSCHLEERPGIVHQWQRGAHAASAVGCVDCHRAVPGEPDAYEHYGQVVARLVTPRDCGRCHAEQAAEFVGSRHGKAAAVSGSIEQQLVELEGAAGPSVAAPGGSGTGGRPVQRLSCARCHGGRVALASLGGGEPLTVDDFQPGQDGKPTRAEAVGRVARAESGAPVLLTSSFPAAGIGRVNLDGSSGSCSACHGRHDFSLRQARSPGGCEHCHLGPSHPQKEIYQQSKHGISFGDLDDRDERSERSWVLGRDYAGAPSCVSCHLGASKHNGARSTHDPARRVSWTHRPVRSQRMDTGGDGEILPAPADSTLVVDTWQDKRQRMRQACLHCHTATHADSHFETYDDLVRLYDQKYAEPGAAIMQALRAGGLLTPAELDEPIEWTWYALWHRAGRRARMAAAMMAPGEVHAAMAAVAELFYGKLVPQARQLARRAATEGDDDPGRGVDTVLDTILGRPEHEGWDKGAK